jgi:multicomponent Na+:H+ antiporter subunit C
MEVMIAILVGIIFSGAVYLILSRWIVRVLLGIVLMGNAVNMLLFLNGRITTELPPVMRSAETVLQAGTANPLPQALVLTAIVISFSLFAFLLVLAFRAYQELGTDDTNLMTLAEHENSEAPVKGY